MDKDKYKGKKLLAILAHPDDESYGLGSVIDKYVKLGVEIHYLCGTKGECGEAPKEILEKFKTVADMRWDEVTNACKVLGVELHYLGFRDSGMEGAESNKHVDALSNRNVEEVSERITQFINEIKPDVITTHDPIGDYLHKDHIMLNKATTMAFDKLQESTQEYKPKKLYFRVFSRRIIRLGILIYPLFGIDPKHYGKNKDVDMTKFAYQEFPRDAIIDVSAENIKVKENAIACYKSQHWNRGGKNIVQKLLALAPKKEYFMRYFPKSNVVEKDLFEGL